MAKTIIIGATSGPGKLLLDGTEQARIATSESLVDLDPPNRWKRRPGQCQLKILIWHRKLGSDTLTEGEYIQNSGAFTGLLAR